MGVHGRLLNFLLNRDDIELRHRTSKAWAKFAIFRNELTDKHSELGQRLRLFKAVVQPSFLYGCVSWAQLHVWSDAAAETLRDLDDPTTEVEQIFGPIGGNAAATTASTGSMNGNAEFKWQRKVMSNGKGKSKGKGKSTKGDRKEQKGGKKGLWRGSKFSAKSRKS